MSPLSCIRTPDGTVLARCPRTGVVASGRTLDEAVDRLQRQSSHTHAREERP